MRLQASRLWGSEAVGFEALRLQAAGFETVGFDPAGSEGAGYKAVCFEAVQPWFGGAYPGNGGCAKDPCPAGFFCHSQTSAWCPSEAGPKEICLGRRKRWGFVDKNEPQKCPGGTFPGNETGLSTSDECHHYPCPVGYFCKDGTFFSVSKIQLFSCCEKALVLCTANPPDLHNYCAKVPPRNRAPQAKCDTRMALQQKKTAINLPSYAL